MNPVSKTKRSGIRAVVQKRWKVTCPLCKQWTTTKSRKVAKDRLYFHTKKGCPETSIAGMWHTAEESPKYGVHYHSDSYNEGYKGNR